MSKHEGTCRSCKAPVYWTTTAKGKKMPVDVKPDTQGKLVLFMNDTGIQSRHEDDATEGQLDRLEGRRYISHFATCVHAAHHRKR